MGGYLQVEFAMHNLYARPVSDQLCNVEFSFSFLKTDSASGTRDRGGRGLLLKARSRLEYFVD